MPPLHLSSSKPTRRDPPHIQSKTAIAICFLVAAVVIMVITIGLLFILRRTVKRHRHIDANSFASSRPPLDHPNRTIRSIHPTSPVGNISVFQDPVADEGLTGEGSNRNGGRHSSTVAESVKNEIMYPQGGIGETPSAPSSRHTPSSSRERISSGQGPNLLSPLPQAVTFLDKKKRPRLAAIVTELPLSNLRWTPQSNSNTPQEGPSSIGNNTKPHTPAEPRSARLPWNDSVVSLQVRSVLETMRRPSETTVPTPGSAAGRAQEVRSSPIVDAPLEEPVRPRARSSSLSQDSIPKRGSVQLASESPVEIKVTRDFDSEGHTLNNGSSRPPWFERASESERRVRKSRALSAISERSINRHASTSTHHHHSTGVLRHLSLGGVSIIHPPPPYTPEDLNPSIVPPLPNIMNGPQPPLISFYVSNGGTEPHSTTSKGKPSSSNSLYDRPLPRSLDVDFEEQPSPVYEPGAYNAHISGRMTKIHRHEQQQQRVLIRQLGVAHIRSSSAPNDPVAPLQTRDLGSRSHPLPPRGDISIRF